MKWSEIEEGLDPRERVYTKDLLQAIIVQCGIDIRDFAKICNRIGVSVKDALEPNFKYCDRRANQYWFNEKRNEYFSAVNCLKNARLTEMVLGSKLTDKDIDDIVNRATIKFHYDRVSKNRDACKRYYEKKKREKNEQ